MNTEKKIAFFIYFYFSPEDMSSLSQSHILYKISSRQINSPERASIHYEEGTSRVPGGTVYDSAMIAPEVESEN